VASSSAGPSASAAADADALIQKYTSYTPVTVRDLQSPSGEDLENNIQVLKKDLIVLREELLRIRNNKRRTDAEITKKDRIITLIQILSSETRHIHSTISARSRALIAINRRNASSSGGKSKPAARKPAARKPAARKPAARKPTARKPSARKPAARKH
jgi:hypothetical protein